MISIAKDKYRITIDDRNVTFYGRRILKPETKAKLTTLTDGERFNQEYQVLGYYNPSRLDYFTQEVVARIIGDAAKAPDIVKGFADYNAIIKDTATKLAKALDIKVLIDKTQRINELEAELADVKKQLATRTGSLTKARKRLATEVAA